MKRMMMKVDKTLLFRRLSSSKQQHDVGCSLAVRFFDAKSVDRQTQQLYPPRTSRVPPISFSPLPRNSTAHDSLPFCYRNGTISVPPVSPPPHHLSKFGSRYSISSRLILLVSSSRRRRRVGQIPTPMVVAAARNNNLSLGLQQQQQREKLIRAGLDFGPIIRLQPQPLSPRRLHQHRQMSSFYSSSPSPTSSSSPSSRPPTAGPRRVDKDGDKKLPDFSASPSSGDNSNSSSNKVLLSHWWQQLQSVPNIITCTRIVCAPLLSYWIVTQQHEAALCGCLLAGFSDYADGQLAKRYHMETTLGTYLDPLADKILINVLAVSVWFVGTLPAPLVALWMGKDILLMTATYRYVANQTPPQQQQQQQRHNTDHSKSKLADDQENTATTTTEHHEHQYYVNMDPLSTPLKVEPTATSKINTALQFVTLATALVHPLCVSGVDVVAGGGVEASTIAAISLCVDPALFYLCWITGGTTILSVFSYAGYSAFTDSGNQQKKISTAGQASSSSSSIENDEIKKT
jgi:phosphatidylglycerophosphate synthase